MFLHVYIYIYIYVSNSIYLNPAFLATLVRDLFDQFSGQVPRQQPWRPLGGPPSGLPRRGQTMFIDNLMYFIYIDIYYRRVVVHM